MKRASINAFGPVDEYIAADITFRLPAAGTLELTLLDDAGNWIGNVIYPPNGYRSFELRPADPSEVEEVTPENTEFAPTTFGVKTTEISNTTKERTHGGA